MIRSLATILALFSLHSAEATTFTYYPFPNYVTAQPTLAAPYVASDWLPVTRAGVEYKTSAQGLMPTIANNTVLGNISGGTTYPSALTTTQLTTLCNTFTSTLKGCVPASGGGTTNFLRADNTFANPIGTCNNSPFLAYTNCAQTYTAAQRGTIQTVAISTATFTPNFDTAQNFSLTLSSACPCTLANPSTTLVAGQSGMIEIIQDGTGSRTIGTWGSQYIAAGATSTITLSTTASAKDRIPYYVTDTTHIMLGAPILNATH